VCSGAAGGKLIPKSITTTKPMARVHPASPFDLVAVSVQGIPAGKQRWSDLARHR
jgi:hypothetical protein